MPDHAALARAEASTRAAVDQISAEAERTYTAAVAAMLAAAAVSARDDDNPTADTIAAAAHTAWRAATRRILEWTRTVVRKLVVELLGHLPREDGRDEWRTVRRALRRRVREIADDYTRDLATQLAEVPGLVRVAAQSAIDDAHTAGDTPTELRDRLTAALDVDEWAARTTRLALTQAGAAFNYAQSVAIEAAQQELDRPVQRMWVSMLDHRVRDSHRAAHGSVAAPDETFTVGGARLRFPGDPTGPAEETFNCRCLIVPVVDDTVIDLADRYLTDDDTTAVAADVDALVALPSRIPAQLRHYWTRGKGATKIRWGAPGDFDRCRRQLRKYVKPGQLDGLCANLHKLATGDWPGRHASLDDGDEECPCVFDEMSDEDLDELLALVTDAVTADNAHEGGMVALIPTPEDAQRLALEHGLPVDELHLTLCFLGPSDEWPEDQRAAMRHVATDVAARFDPIEAQAWASAAFNPGSDSECITYLIGDTPELVDIHAQLDDVVSETFGDLVPAQHRPWVPHITVAYNTTDIEQMTEHGPLVFDRIRVVFAGEHIDTPLRQAHTSGEDNVDTTTKDEHDTETADAVTADAIDVDKPYEPGVETGDDVPADDTTPDVEQPEPEDEPEPPCGGGEEDTPSDPPVDGDPADGDDPEPPTEEPSDPAPTEPPVHDDPAPVEPPVHDDTPTTPPTEDPAPVEPPVHDDNTRPGDTVPDDPDTPKPPTLAAAVESASIVAQGVANAPKDPHPVRFDQRPLDGPTPITVTADGQIYGHIALWNTCHRGIRGECVTPPRSKIDYAAFHQYPYPDTGNQVASVGFLLAGCDHAAIDASEAEARDYHERACTRVAAVRAYEDDHGIQVTGVLVPGVTEDLVADLRHISGEWRAVSLELMAAVGVDDPGYPVAPLDATTVAVAASADTGYAPTPSTERALALIAHIPLVDDDAADVDRYTDVIADKVVTKLQAITAQQEQRTKAAQLVANAKKRAATRKFDAYKRGKTHA
ncbi:phage minor head protein [Saccharomonospora azurea]|uniref:phage minor head protein n=1 Tax=Saccharomonospora azurea TaxID=40988 RepID=UPI00331E9119